MPRLSCFSDCIQDERDKAVGGFLRPLQAPQGVDDAGPRRGARAGCLFSTLRFLFFFLHFLIRC